MFASSAVPPFWTTVSSIAVMVCAVCGVITWRTGSGPWLSSTVPSGSTTLRTRNGRISCPWFAIAESTLIGQYFIIFVAALQDVPHEFYEAAEIDGASGFRTMWSVTLPMISPAFYFNLVTCFIGEFQIFDMPWVMTLNGGGQTNSGGGPGYSSTTFSLYMYMKMFQEYDAGTASAMAMISLVLVLGISIAMIRASTRFVTYER